MRRLWLVIAMVALVPGAGADECVPIGADPDVMAAGFYLEEDACQPDCGMSTWLYQESNGVPGLQRSDAFADHTCGGVLPPDTLLFGARL